MKARNVLVTGQEIDDYSDGRHFVNSNKAARRNQVVPGAMIAGNHRDPNNWSYDVIQKKWPYGQATTWNLWLSGPPSWRKLSGYIRGSDEPQGPPWDRNGMYNQALNRLNDKVRGGTDLGVSLAEAGQTYMMLAQIAKIREWARIYRGIGDPGNLYRDVANGWLLFQYGWRPLLSDLFGILNNSLDIVLAHLSKVNASAKHPLGGLGTVTRAIKTNLPCKATSVGQGKEVCRFSIVVELPGQTLDRWTSLNPISLAWELIPYSFVVDWFYDIGGLLRNAETALLYDCRFKSGYYSELYVYDGEESCKPNQVWNYPLENPPRRENIDFWTSSIRLRSFRRTKLTSYPLPRSPSFSVDLGSEQLLSLAALLSQFLGKH